MSSQPPLPKTTTILLSTFLLFLLLPRPLPAQTQNISALNADDFHSFWQIESESPDYQLSFRHDTAEIRAPKGLTLWRKQKMSGNTTIEYDACVVVENDSDRLSDLNCFWMASDPLFPDSILARADWRNGIFVRAYSLQLYYLGFGGNYNTTTRFRRYDGNQNSVDNADLRPAILKEYTDPAHLLAPNKWYHIKIENQNQTVRFYINGNLLIDYTDPQPLTAGWFGFRTTLSRTRITNFSFSAN